MIKPIKQRIIALALSLLLAAASPALAQSKAQPASNHANETVELYQSLLDLTNAWTVLCVAAHPDDEDGATLTMLRRKYGVHTASLFSTFGEGGQNAIGPELYEELGAIRARETRAAALIQGSEPYFLALRDFGFSKSADEAFRVWNHDEALSRMVRKIRELRPDVIITNHDTTGGHGHHQATGRLVLEAFDAAADPARFPEQLGDGLKVWQPQRLFVRMSYEGGAASKALDEEATRKGAVVTINRNELDPVRQQTYAEQALAALQQHATQGPWPDKLPAGGVPVMRYRLARSAKDAGSLPANAQTFLDGLRLPEAIANKFAPPTIEGRPLTDFVNQRERVLDALIAARKAGLFSATARDEDAARFRLMSERLDHALATASSMSVKLSLRDAVLVPGTQAFFVITFSNQGNDAAHVRGAMLGGNARNSNIIIAPPQLAPKSESKFETSYDAPRDETFTVPHAEHLYDAQPFGKRFDVSVNMELNGATFPVRASTWVDVAPAVEIASITPSPLIATPAIARTVSSSGPTIGSHSKMVTFDIRLTNHQNTPFEGEIVAGNPDDKTSSQRQSFSLPAQGSLDLKMRVSSSFSGMDFGPRGTKPLPNTISFSIVRANSSVPLTRQRVSVAWSDAQVAPHLRVGYVRSFDETLRNALSALGVEAKELTVEDVRAGNLKQYDTIIIDNRGYQAHAELIAINARLLDYVREGGTLIVFYHKTNEWNPDARASRPQLAPYPITLGNERVTDENAAVTFTEPQSALLNYPNKIGPEDFKDWIQERGLYYPKEWDAHYSAPLAMSDAGETPLRGGLLAAEYGRGRYIYTSIVWYRQLRAGVPGAYRVFANMLSYGHTKTDER